MSEISEVRNIRVCNKKTKKIVDVEYHNQTNSRNRKYRCNRKTLSTTSRGKEMLIDNEPVVITLGMSGGFKNSRTE